MKTVAIVAMLAACVSAPALAASDAATRFGVREDIQQISLSPDGAHIAIVQPRGSIGNSVAVLDVKTGAQTIAANASGQPERLSYCRWATNVRLVCGLQIVLEDVGQPLGFTRMIAVDFDGKNLKLLSKRDNARALYDNHRGGEVIDWLGETNAADASPGGSVLMTRNFIPEDTLDTNVTSTRTGVGVERVDTLTLKRTIVEAPRPGAVEYITDGHGAVRIMGVRGTDGLGYDKTSIKYLYRRSGSRTWEDLGTVTDTSGFNPYAVDHDRNIAYGFDTVNGYKALFSVALDGTKTRTQLLARPDVDLDNVVQVGRQNRVVGVSYVTDRGTTEFFDPELKKLRAGLGKALPALPLISFVDASADETKLLLFAGSDVDPGHYYLFDKTTHKLDEVTPARAQLVGVKLASVKPVSYPAADGTMIPAYLTLPPGSDGKNLPTIVMPHGGPEDRDSWNFDYLAQFLANRGFAVLQPNFRGSTGYGEAWFKHNGFQSWRTAVGDVNDGGRWLVKTGVADPAKLAIVGWSYGGYAALQSTVIAPNLFKAIVAIAPLTDFETWRQEFVDFTNFTNIDQRVGHGPHVVQGSPAQNAGRITAPVLLFHGDHDQNVGIGESRMMASRLKGAGKPVELVEFHGLDHQIDDSAARAQMLDKMDGFLRTTLGLPAMP